MSRRSETRYALIFASLCFATNGSAQEAPPPPAKPQPPPQSSTQALVVAGGVSLGAYQGGFLYYYLEFLKSKREAGRPLLASVSGASAGSINATIAAIESCRTTNNDPHKSPFWETWVPVGIDELLPANMSSVTRLGLMSRKPLERSAEKLQAYLDSSSGWVKAPCTVPVGVVITRLNGVDTPVGQGNSLYASNSVESVGFAIDVSFDQSGSIRQHRLAHLNKLDTVRHPGSASGPTDRPTFGEVRDLLFASSSFPLAFAPQRVVAHDELKEPTTNYLYIDGGVFDNVPVKLASTLSGASLRGSQDSNTPADTEKLIVDSDVTPWKSRTHTESDPTSITDAVTRFLGNFLGTARTQRLLDAKGSDLRMPERRAMLTSDYLFAFSGFLDQRFREFDFYMGMLDARAYVLADPNNNDWAALDAAPKANPINNTTFNCFKKLERLSLQFRQSPDWDEALEECHAPEIGGTPEEYRLREMIALFRASVATKAFATSGEQRGELETFNFFLEHLSESGISFRVHDEDVEAVDLVFVLRRLAGDSLEYFAKLQPDHPTAIGIGSDVILNETFLHMAPRFYWSLGVHLKQGAEVETSWAIDVERRQRLGLALRLRDFGLVERFRSTAFADAHYEYGWHPGANWTLSTSAHLGLGYKFHDSYNRDGVIERDEGAGIRQSIAGAITLTMFERVYVRGDYRRYSRMSRHWPRDYDSLDVGLGLGWRFH